MPVNLINTFKVPEDQEDEFLSRWSETSAVYARNEGFIETHMHRNTGVGNPTFNLARTNELGFWYARADHHRNVSVKVRLTDNTNFGRRSRYRGAR